MPVDGTYGRLSGHNQRFKELRRKKQERKERNLRSGLSITNLEHNRKTQFNTVEPEKLDAIKLEIQRRAKRKLYIEFFAFIVSLVIACVIFYLLFIK